MIHLFAFVKMVADTCLWLAGSSVILSLFYPVANLALAAPLLGLGAGLAHWLSLKKPNLRLLGTLPALLGLALCRSGTDLLIFLPGYGYLLLCAAKQQLQTDQTQLYYRFKGRAAVTIVIGLLCVARHISWGFWGCILALACSVFLLRMLRHDISDFSDRKLVTLELGLMAVVSVVIIALSQNIVLDSSVFLIKMGYKYIIAPIFVLGLTLLMLVIRLFDWILSQFFTGKFEMDFSGMAQQSFEAVEEYFPEGVAGNSGGNIVLLILKVIGILLFLGAAFLIFRYLLSGASKAVAAKGSEDGRTELDVQEVVSGPVSILDRSPEARVRRAYASYCRAVSKYKKKISPMDTTRAVNILAELEQNPDAEKLRALYIRARYTSQEPLSGKDARDAGSIARDLKSKLEKSQ